MASSAAAFVLPHPELGAVVGAVVDIGDASVTDRAMRVWLGERLDAARRPVRLEISRAPLRNDAGKVFRSQWSRRAVPAGYTSVDDTVR